MKIAIIQETIASARGGAETSTLEMARQLADLGTQVTIFHRGPDVTPAAAGSAQCVALPAAGRTKAARTYRFIQNVHSACRNGDFDIRHAVTPCLCANVYQPRGGTLQETVARTLARVPAPWRWLKAIGRRFNTRQRFLYHLERTLLIKRQANVHVAALSDYVKRQVEIGYRFPAEQVTVVFNGVDVPALEDDERCAARTALRHTLQLGPETPTLLFVAHNFALKGLAELLGALHRGVHWQHADWHLLVAGRDRTAPYQRAARRFGVAERVHFIGAEHPVRQLYAAADVLAHPTWYDPCSRVVLEALSVGLPVVTTRYNGAAEALQTGRHGMVIAEPSDMDALADALRQALEPQVRAACRADAPHFRTQFSMARHARELLALYERILSRR